MSQKLVTFLRYSATPQLARLHIIQHLLIILVRIIIDNIEEPELIHPLRGRYHPQPITELLLLEEFLRPVTIVSAPASIHVPHPALHPPGKGRGSLTGT